MKIKKVNELNSNIKEEYLLNKQDEIKKLKSLLEQVYQDGGDNMEYDDVHGYENIVTFSDYWDQYGDKLILDSGILD